MSDKDSKYKYGSEGKSIVFQDSDKRHADLRIRLRHDGLTQIEFFRGMITGYIQKDPRIIEYVVLLKERLAKQGKAKIRKTSEMINKGEDNFEMFSFSKEEEKKLFDLIAEEFPEL